MKKIFPLIFMALVLFTHTKAYAQEVPISNDPNVTQIALPINFTRCPHLYYPLTFLQYIRSGESDITAYLYDHDGEYREIPLSPINYICADLSAWCWIHDTCSVVQIVLDDRLSDLCWKSDFVFDYDGNFAKALMYTYNDPICDGDITAP